MPKPSINASLDEIKNETLTEIEVTPAMTEAGAPLLLSFHREYGPDAHETVAAIFRAMVAAQPINSSNDHSYPEGSALETWSAAEILALHSSSLRPVISCRHRIAES